MRSELSESARKEIIQRHAHYERERRTAACIKACEGIPTETLEGGFEAINAELLEALKEMVSLHKPYSQALGKPDAGGMDWDSMGCNPLSRARAAISKAEEA